MESTVKCPICGHKCKRTYYDESFGLCEEYIICDTCGYDYGFAYGSHYEHIHNKEFMWSYATPFSHPIFKRMKRDAFMAKRNWKKMHKKCVTENAGKNFIF